MNKRLMVLVLIFYLKERGDGNEEHPAAAAI